MVDKIVHEIEQALDNNMFISALSLALILPDMCGKAAYPNLKSGARYKKWYSEYMGKYEKPPMVDGVQMPYMNAEVVYQLRCSLFHQGDLSIDNEKINEKNIIDDFVIVIEKTKDFNIYGGEMSGISQDFPGEGSKKSYRVNVQNFCRKMCLNAMDFYESNKGKFNFFNYRIVDWDEVTAKLPSVDVEEFMRVMADGRH